MMFYDLMVFSPEFLLLIFALIAFGAAAFGGDASQKAISLTFKISLCLCLGLAVLEIQTSNELWAFSDMFAQNSFTKFFKILILSMVLGVYLVISPYLDSEGLGKPEFPALMAFATMGYMLMISSQNFISLFLSTELASFATYLMVAFNRENLHATEAGLKYFILGALATAFLLFGVSFIYGVTGSTAFHDIMGFLTTYPETNDLLSIGILLILAAFAFKTSLAPLHMWIPDVYEGSPTPVTTFLTTVPKLAAFGVFIRVMMELFHTQGDLWQPVLGGLALLSMVVGSFTALFQKNIKRIIAYSTIAHMGYGLLGLMTAKFQGISSILTYLTIYTITIFGVFTCLLSLKRQGKFLENLEDFKGLGIEMPFVSAALMIFLFSLAGLPPLAGFFAKLTIFSGALQSGYTALAIVGILTSVVGAGFYLKIVKVMYFESTQGVADPMTRPDRTHARATIFFMILALFLNLCYIFQPNLLAHASYKATKSIFIKI